MIGLYYLLELRRETCQPLLTELDSIDIIQALKDSNINLSKTKNMMDATVVLAKHFSMVSFGY